MSNRQPPIDLDAEMALLGSMMMDRDGIANVIPVINRSQSAWFSLPEHQVLFEVLLDIYDNPDQVVDLIVVVDYLKKKNLLTKVGGEDYIIKLAESFADWANTEYYARIVSEKGMLRDLIQTARDIAMDAYKDFEDASVILDRAESKIYEVTEHRITNKPARMRSTLVELSEQLRDPDQTMTVGVPTGLKQLDMLTSGFNDGELIIIAARPSMGKTALGLTMAYNMAVVEKLPVLFFSMEMGRREIGQRLIAMHLGVDLQRLRTNMLRPEELLLLNDANLNSLFSSPIVVDVGSHRTPMEVRACARRMKQKEDIQAIFVDYLQLMHCPGNESRQTEIATISRQLKGLARELGVPVIALSQLNRQSEQRTDKRPMMSDLRESGAIEQDADVIIMIHREGYYKRDDPALANQGELNLAKQRNGPTGNVMVHFDKRIAKFSTLHMGMGM